MLLLEENYFQSKKLEWSDAGGNKSWIISYRVVDVSHLQKVLGAAVLLHLYGLPPPLHGYTITFGEICVRGHLHVAALEDDLVDVILVFPIMSDIKKKFNFCQFNCQKLNWFN